MTPEDYRLKFEEPYKPLLDAGVKFYAVLGNHDDPRQVHYPPFHMDGNRYYTFTPPVNLISKLDTSVRFFAIDSTRLDGEQIEWLQRELERSTADWKILLMHYPIYSTGRYTLRARRQRFVLEPSLVAGGIDVTFAGHEHIYQRSRPPERDPALHQRRSGVAESRGRKALRRRGEELRSRLSLHAGGSVGRQNVLSGHQQEGRDGRRRLVAPPETSGPRAGRYCGHAGPSLIALTFDLKTRTQSATLSWRDGMNPFSLSKRAAVKRSASCRSVS